MFPSSGVAVVRLAVHCVFRPHAACTRCMHCAVMGAVNRMRLMAGASCSTGVPLSVREGRAADETRERRQEHLARKDWLRLAEPLG